MKILQLIIRTGLGLMLISFGLNKFFWFMPEFNFGEDVAAKGFFESLTDSSYMWPLVGITEFVVGFLLVIKKWVPFALVMLVPISVNIVLFHLMLNPANIGPAILVSVLNAYLIYKHWCSYSSLFS